MALALTVGIHGAGGRRRLALMPGLAAVCLAGLLTHATFVFVIGALLTTVLLPGAPRAAVIMPVLAAGALFGVAWGPVVVATAALPATAWIPKPSVDALFAGYSMLWGPRNGYMLAGAVLAVALVDPRSARRVAADRPFVAVALAAVFLLVAPVLVSLLRPVFVPARTPILALPALAIAGSVLLQKLGSTPLRWVLGLMLAFSAARTVVDVYRAGDPAPTTRHLSRLLSELKCGDTIVASGLSYAPAAYAWRRLEAPACIELVPFPREVQEHPGWIDPMMADRQRASLEREAEALALARRGGGRLAVLAATRGVGRDVSAVLLDGLNRNFTLESSTSRPGTFFDSVVIYRPSIK